MPPSILSKTPPILCSLAAATFVGYFGLVFLLDETILGIYIGGTLWTLLTFGTFVSSYVLFSVLFRSLSSQFSALAANVSLSLLVTVSSLLLFETAYSIVRPGEAATSSIAGYGRDFDANYQIGEYYPRVFYPTPANFRLFKPNMSVTASSFGVFYSSAMAGAPTLTQTVLERRTVSFQINELGFRETLPIANATLFALGDSFTFGWGVNMEQSWIKLLETSLRAPVYNLGLSGASPQQEVNLLKHLLVTKGLPVRSRRIIWQVYEGNDLEDGYGEMTSAEQRTETTQRTLPQVLSEIPHALKHQSIIYKFRSNRLRVRSDDRQIPAAHWEADGVKLSHPLLSSERLGSRLFYPLYIDRFQQPRSYVLNHPNRPALEAAFAEMAELSRRFGFEVTVLLVPTAERVHGPYFTDFPKLAPPYLLDYVAGLAQKQGFQIVDLLKVFQPCAGSTLLYFRDDDHWNEQGHRAVAKTLSQHLAPNERTAPRQTADLGCN